MGELYLVPFIMRLLMFHLILAALIYHLRLFIQQQYMMMAMDKAERDKLFQQIEIAHYMGSVVLALVVR